MTETAEEIVIHPRSKLPPDKIPRVKKGPLGLLTWFKAMTERYGDHPRFVAECTEIVLKAGIEPHDITEAVLLQATRECLPLAKEWAEAHNAAEQRGEAIGVVVVHDEYWLTGRHPDPTVRQKKAAQLERINQREVEEPPDEPYTSTVTETNTAHEQEIENVTTATATKPVKTNKISKKNNPDKKGTEPRNENPEKIAADAPKVDLTPKPLRVSDTSAVKLLKDLGFLNADKYDSKKLAEKLGRLGKAGPGDDAEPNESSQKLLKKLAIAVNDGQEIQIVSEDKAKPEPSTNGHPPKKGKKDKTPVDDFGPIETTRTTTEAPKKKKGEKPAKEKKEKTASDKRGKKGLGKGGMSLLDAAAKLFSEDNTPRTPKELVADILKKKYWGPTNSPTPFDTVKVAMIQEMKKKGDESRFYRPEPGKYALVK